MTLDVLEVSLLYDFYGELLSSRQREVMSLYHEENLSLSEIAEEFGISRQGVHDTLKKAEKSLLSYEEKLGLVQKFETTNRLIASIDGRIESVISSFDEEDFRVRILREIRADIDKME